MIQLILTLIALYSKSQSKTKHIFKAKIQKYHSEA